MPTKRVGVAGGHRLFHPQVFQGAHVECEYLVSEATGQIGSAEIVAIKRGLPSVLILL
jgi:hypothetical protein